MKSRDRIPAEFHEPKPEEPTVIIRYAINAEILLFHGATAPVVEPVRRPRNGTPLEGPLASNALVAGVSGVPRLDLVGLGGDAACPADRDDRHWADQGL